MFYNINTFETLHKPKLETPDVIQVKVKHQFTNEYTFIEALSYPLICKPLKNQEISLANHDLLPGNYKICENRLINLKKRLVNDKILNQYNEIFLNYERRGIIEKVPLEEITKVPGKVHYLAHRPVIQNDRETTKIRAVFDASCSINGPSLKVCVYSGLNLLGKIFDILLRFGLNYNGILADIQKAFRNIEISPEHIDFLKFLWYDFRNNDVEKGVGLRFTRAVLGLISSPFLLNGTI